MGCWLSNRPGNRAALCPIEPDHYEKEPFESEIEPCAVLGKFKEPDRRQDEIRASSALTSGDYSAYTGGARACTGTYVPARS